VRDTLCTLPADPRYLGAQPGILAALHTWSQTLVLHPHVHCLVTGGGLTPDGQWKAVRQGFLLPARVVMAVFRGKMLEAIRQAWACGELGLPEGMRPQPFLNLLNRLGHPRKTKWNVHIRERYAHGVGVVTYLARYLRGGPIKNARLVAWDGARVTFTWRARPFWGRFFERGSYAQSIARRAVPVPLARCVLTRRVAWPALAAQEALPAGGGPQARVRARRSSRAAGPSRAAPPGEGSRPAERYA
jgi:putative transposase